MVSIGLDFQFTLRAMVYSELVQISRTYMGLQLVKYMSLLID